MKSPKVSVRGAFVRKYLEFIGLKPVDLNIEPAAV